MFDLPEILCQLSFLTQTSHLSGLGAETRSTQPYESLSLALCLLLELNQESSLLNTIALA